MTLLSALPTEQRRLNYPGTYTPTLFQWYVSWVVDDLRGEALAWLMHDAKVPALLCTELSAIRGYAPTLPQIGRAHV